MSRALDRIADAGRGETREPKALRFWAMSRHKRVYKITYPNGTIYMGMDLTGTVTYLKTSVE